MIAPDYAARREDLRPLLRRAGLAALLVSLDADRYYLSGFELHDPQPDESAGRLLVCENGRDILCTDSRFLDAARRIWPEEDIFVYKGSAAEQINILVKDRFSGPVGFDSRHLSLRFYEDIAPGLDLRRADGMVESLRVLKDAAEIERLKKSCALNHALMLRLPDMARPGRTEAQIAWDIEQFFRNHGAEGLSFASIVAVGPNAALPHAVPGDDTISDNCGLLVDVGCRLDAYCSDQTRSFWVGDRPDPVFQDHLGWIQEAQTLAIQAIRPGALCSDIYGVTRKFLDGKGVGHLFTHGLGHGVGLQTHEPPSLNPASQTVLQPGMVVTVEPGIYRSGLGGVRWEYMVLVTPDGAEVL